MHPEKIIIDERRGTIRPELRRSRRARTIAKHLWRFWTTPFHGSKALWTECMFSPKSPRSRQSQRSGCLPPSVKGRLMNTPNLPRYSTSRYLNLRCPPSPHGMSSPSSSLTSPAPSPHHPELLSGHAVRDMSGWTCSHWTCSTVEKA